MAVRALSPLNTPLSGPSSPVQATGIVERATIEKAKAFVLDNWETITDSDLRFKEEKNENSLFHFYGAKHCVAFFHSDFPGLVLKVMSVSQAQESKKFGDFANKAFTEEKFKYCHAPAADTIELPKNKMLLVMEKATGNTDQFNAQEEMEKEFELIESDLNIAAKWQQMTREVAQATAKIGYWDSQPKNLIWDSQKGFSFIDFERIGPNRDNIKTGLSRLAEIFPPQFVDEIYDVAEEKGIKLEQTREATKTARVTQFQLSRDLSHWNLEKGLPRILDKERWEPASWERKIVEKFDENRNQDWYRNHPPAQTELFWQPFTFRTIPGSDRPFPTDGEEYKKIGHPIYLENRAAFELALENLKAAGVVRTWKSNDTYHQPFLIDYTIFF